jgi:hypothetical protein
MRNNQLLSAMGTGRECMKIRNMGEFGCDRIANHRFLLCKCRYVRSMLNEEIFRLLTLPNKRQYSRNWLAKCAHINATTLGLFCWKVPKSGSAVFFQFAIFVTASSVVITALARNLKLVIAAS